MLMPLFTHFCRCWSACICLVLSPALLATAAHGQTANISEQYLLAAANRERADHDLKPVSYDPDLAHAALLHAREMATRRTISHRFEGEPDLAYRVHDVGVHFSLVTENVAEASNSSLIHDLWMQSAGHRANLLDPKVDSIGVAVVASRGQLYAVEDFARTVKDLSLPEQEGIVAHLVTSTGLNILEDSRDARRTCAMSTGFAGRYQPWFVMRYTAADLHQLPGELTERIATGKYTRAAIGACVASGQSAFSSYTMAVLLYP